MSLWYLDDGTLAGSPSGVLEDFGIIRSQMSALGMEVNSTKCELFIVPKDSAEHNGYVQDFDRAVPGIRLLDLENFTILGAPMTEPAIKVCLEEKTEALRRMADRLTTISAHCGFYLLKNSQAIPKLTYMLRCAPTWICPDSLCTYDGVLRSALESVTNAQASDMSWALPISKGGLGIRHAEDLALPAFLASASSVSNLVKSLLPESMSGRDDPPFLVGVDSWINTSSSEVPPPELQRLQRKWEEPLVELAASRLLSNASSPKEKVRFLGVSSSESGSWLNVLPNPNIGTFLDNDSFRVAIALRLGSPICRPHVCPCGALVDESGTHGLSCRRSAGRLSRHGAVNDLIKRALVSAGVPARLEPSGLSRDDGKRPDGMTLVPWERGRSMVWDFTCTDTLAPSFLKMSSCIRGHAASAAEERKTSKYSNLGSRFVFCPLAVETLGTFGPATLSTIRMIGQKIASSTGEKRSTSFLIQRIGVAVQRGNAAAVLNTIPQSESLDDVITIL